MTTNKGLSQPANGSNVDTWDVPVNANFGYIDQAFGATTSLNATSGSATLADTQYRSLSLSISGAISANVTYTIPSSVGGQWIIYNTTTDASGGPWSIIIASGGGGTTVAIQRNKSTVISSDGTNIRSVYAESLTVAPLPFPSGTAMLFAQTSAPTGWTKSTTHDNKALRVVSGAASSGGTVSFTSAFTSQAVAGTVGDTTLTLDQIPAHNHDPLVAGGGNGSTAFFSNAMGSTPYSASSRTTNWLTTQGGGLSHTHTFTGTAINLAVQYVDVIIATKD
jgi:hypothetical protein